MPGTLLWLVDRACGAGPRRLPWHLEYAVLLPPLSPAPAPSCQPTAGGSCPPSSAWRPSGSLTYLSPPRWRPREVVRLYLAPLLDAQPLAPTLFWESRGAQSCHSLAISR